MNAVVGKTSLMPQRQRPGALYDASRHSRALRQRASVLNCGGPPPLWNSAPPVNSNEHEIPKGDGL
jgi:hypothetical protein